MNSLNAYSYTNILNAGPNEFEGVERMGCGEGYKDASTIVPGRREAQTVSKLDVKFSLGQTFSVVTSSLTSAEVGHINRTRRYIHKPIMAWIIL